MRPPAGIIAAGEGSRLSHRDVKTIKPLIPVAGRPLSHWIVDRLHSAGARDFTVLLNSRGTAVAPSLSTGFPDINFDFMIQDTASSFESFRLVARRLGLRFDSFLISTVDAIIPAPDVERFWNECRASNAEAGLALTAHVDDENPLWAEVNDAGLVTALGEDAKIRRLVTCGLYYLTTSATQNLPLASNHRRLRDYWRTLVASGAVVYGSILSKTLDIDRPTDIVAAESYLRNVI